MMGIIGVTGTGTATGGCGIMTIVGCCMSGTMARSGCGGIIVLGGSGASKVSDATATVLLGTTMATDLRGSDGFGMMNSFLSPFDLGGG